jgi:pyruvate/2-oxoglutarate dehydrogenase complex dihydrolipoamide acyltransferase (E2) component
MSRGKKRKDAFKKARGFSLAFLPFIARAPCLAFQAFPQINARFT